MGTSIDECLRFFNDYFKTKIDANGDQNGYLNRKQFKELINAYCDKISTTRLDNQVIANLLSSFTLINNDMIPIDEINNNVNQIDKTIHFNTILNKKDNFDEASDHEENKGNVFDSKVAHRHNTNFVKDLRKKLESTKELNSMDQYSNQINSNQMPNDDSNDRLFDEMIAKNPKSLLNIRNDKKRDSIKSDSPHKLYKDEIKQSPEKKGSGRNISIMSGSDIKNH